MKERCEKTLLGISQAACFNIVATKATDYCATANDVILYRRGNSKRPSQIEVKPVQFVVFFSTRDVWLPRGLLY
jgi:hypothetical protein